MNILVNQCKYPGIYNECFCLSCNVKDKDKDKDKDQDLRSSFANNNNVNVNQGSRVADDLRSSFANNVNDNDNDIDNDNVNDNVNYNKNINDNINQGTCFADDNFIYQRTCLASHEQSSFADLFGEKHQKGKPNNNGETWTKSHSPTNNISVNINEDLISWLDDDNIITEATLPENFRCIISGPSECGKTFLLKKLILARIYFD